MRLRPADPGGMRRRRPGGPARPRGAAAAACEKLGERLPQKLDGADRVESTPASPYVAVWGAGQIALRCGVPRLAAMAATDQVPEIDGVAWFPRPRPADAVHVDRTGGLRRGDDRPGTHPCRRCSSISRHPSRRRYRRPGERCSASWISRSTSWG
ncbi:DUF3515 family protein [Streptosporangium lutulentum]